MILLIRHSFGMRKITLTSPGDHQFTSGKFFFFNDKRFALFYIGRSK